MKYALIELPNPNSAEAKYKSQIPTPNNLLQTATALELAGHEVEVYNFFRERYPEMIEADAYVFDFFPCTCMDYYGNFALEYLDSYRIFMGDKPAWVIGFYAWLNQEKMPFPVAPPRNFEDIIAGPIGSIYDAEYPVNSNYYNAWHLFDFNSIPRYKDGHNRITIRASRGCPYSCSMCPVTLSHGGGILKRHPIAWVLHEIDMLYEEHDIWDIGFLDDNLFSDQAWAMELLLAMKAKGYRKKGLRFTFEEGLDVPTANNEDIIRLLKENGFYHIKLGVETFDSKTLEAINKPYRNPALAISAIKLLQSYKLSPVCFQMIGLPTQTRESITDDTQLFKREGVKVRAQILWEYPGTSVHPTLSAGDLKELCYNALLETGSLTWKPKDKKEK